MSLTCCEGVAGIQTHSNSGLISHFIYDALQLGELTPDRTALTAHVLQHWPHEAEKTRRHYQFDIHINHYIIFLSNLPKRLIQINCFGSCCSFLKLRAVFAIASVFLLALHCSVFLSHQRHLGYVGQKDCGMSPGSQQCEASSQFCTLKVMY